MPSLTASQIRERILQGDLAASDVVQATFERIQKYDDKIGAFLSLSQKRAEQKAETIDRKRKTGAPLGRLAGVTFALKDNIHVEGEPTTCASKILANYKAPFSATVTRLLEEEDAIFIGKTNLDEFAMGSSTENSAFQQTRNPWDLDCVPGGSSGGSAAAVAARLVQIGFGSDTGGSIRQPAALCGVVGFKPTYGRVSRHGLVAFGSSLDQIGPLTTNVEDAALCMSVIASHCKYDSTSIPLKAQNYLEMLKTPFVGTTVGVPWNFISGLTEAAKENFLFSIETLKKLGCTIIDVDLDILKTSVAIYYILATAEASTNLARFDGIRYGLRSERATTLEEVYDFSKQEGFGPEVKSRILLGTYVLSSGYQEAYYHQAQKVRSLMINKFKEAYSLCSMIAMPTSPFPAFPAGSIQDPLQMYLQDIYTIGANLAGLPAISVPSGFDKTGKPWGLQLIGPQLQDGQVLVLAQAFENATSFNRHPPLFLDT